MGSTEVGVVEEGWREPRGRSDCHTLFIGVGLALQSDLRGFWWKAVERGGGGRRMIRMCFVASVNYYF